MAAYGTNHSRTLTLANRLGLHARAAARIVQLVQTHDCRIFFIKGERRAEGDSILSLLTLNCPQGSQVQVRAEGPQAETCLEALDRLFQSRFGEE